MTPCLRFTLLLLLPLAIAGCMTFSPPSGTVGNDKPNEVVVAPKTGDSASVTLNKGDTLKLILTGNPTTGFTWERAPGTGKILAEDGTIAYTSARNDLSGSPGEFTFTFKAINPGEETLTMRYRRSFEKDVPPAKTFLLNVTVKPENT